MIVYQIKIFHQSKESYRKMYRMLRIRSHETKIEWLKAMVFQNTYYHEYHWFYAKPTPKKILPRSMTKKA